jgi:hypothetical protein
LSEQIYRKRLAKTNFIADFADFPSISESRITPFCDVCASCFQSRLPFRIFSAILCGAATLRETEFLIWVVRVFRIRIRGAASAWRCRTTSAVEKIFEIGIAVALI